MSDSPFLNNQITGALQTWIKYQINMLSKFSSNEILISSKQAAGERVSDFPGILNELAK